MVMNVKQKYQEWGTEDQFPFQWGKYHGKRATCSSSRKWWSCTLIIRLRMPSAMAMQSPDAQPQRATNIRLQY